MKELISIISELHAPKGLKNTFGGFQYRNAEGILEAVKPLLTKNNCYLTTTSTVEQIGNRFYIKTEVTITNSEGKSISASAMAREQETKKGMDDAQVTGASITYSKKYALCNLFCIDDSDSDPDTTNTGEDKTSTSQPTQQTTPPAPTTNNAGLNPKKDETKQILTPEELCKVWLTKETREDANEFYNTHKDQIDITKEPFASTIKQISTKFPKQQ